MELLVYLRKQSCRIPRKNSGRNSKRNIWRNSRKGSWRNLKSKESNKNTPEEFSNKKFLKKKLRGISEGCFRDYFRSPCWDPSKIDWLICLYSRDFQFLKKFLQEFRSHWNVNFGTILEKIHEILWEKHLKESSASIYIEIGRTSQIEQSFFSA